MWIGQPWYYHLQWKLAKALAKLSLVIDIDLIKYSILMGGAIWIIMTLVGTLVYHTWPTRLAAHNTLHSVISAPIFEELLFRLGALGVILEVTGSILIAIILSSLLFAIAHMAWLPVGYRILDTFIVGAILGYLFITYGLVSAIIAHMTANSITEILQKV